MHEAAALLSCTCNLNVNVHAAHGSRCCASLLQVNVQVEIKDDKTAIPRNSLIEANQSGLIAESLIDITPQQPIPQYKVGLCLVAPPGRCQKRDLSQRSSRSMHSDVRASIAFQVRSAAC